MAKGIPGTCTVRPRHSCSLLLPFSDDIYSGERTATALEAKLDGIHRNLDQLLASFEEMAQSKGETEPSGTNSK